MILAEYDWGGYVLTTVAAFREDAMKLIKENLADRNIYPEFIDEEDFRFVELHEFQGVVRWR